MYLCSYLCLQTCDWTRLAVILCFSFMFSTKTKVWIFFSDSWNKKVPIISTLYLNLGRGCIQSKVMFRKRQENKMYRAETCWIISILSETHPYLSGCWSWSPGLSPPGGTRPLPAAWRAPALTGSGWALAATAHSDPTWWPTCGRPVVRRERERSVISEERRSNLQKRKDKIGPVTEHSINPHGSFYPPTSHFLFLWQFDWKPKV